ncbi:hypothetical protein EDB85DRAFT_2186410 [Lactarius pseudohatsudake]|nr:hypothetical protein EDB85DRAFT_2186410 [Lactarius pseudohatsudake]
MTTVVYETSSVRPAPQFPPRPGHPSPLRAGHANPTPPRLRTQREGRRAHQRVPTAHVYKIPLIFGLLGTVRFTSIYNVLTLTTPYAADLAHPLFSTSLIQGGCALMQVTVAGHRHGGRNYDDPLSMVRLCNLGNHGGPPGCPRAYPVTATVTATSTMTACSHTYPGITSTVVDITRWQKIAMVSGRGGNSKVTTTVTAVGGATVAAGGIRSSNQSPTLRQSENARRRPPWAPWFMFNNASRREDEDAVAALFSVIIISILAAHEAVKHGMSDADHTDSTSVGESHMLERLGKGCGKARKITRL